MTLRAITIGVRCADFCATRIVYTTMVAGVELFYVPDRHAVIAEHCVIRRVSFQMFTNKFRAGLNETGIDIKWIEENQSVAQPQLLCLLARCRHRSRKTGLRVLWIKWRGHDSIHSGLF